MFDTIAIVRRRPASIGRTRSHAGEALKRSLAHQIRDLLGEGNTLTVWRDHGLTRVYIDGTIPYGTPPVCYPHHLVYQCETRKLIDNGHLILYGPEIRTDDGRDFDAEMQACEKLKAAICKVCHQACACGPCRIVCDEYDVSDLAP